MRYAVLQGVAVTRCGGRIAGLSICCSPNPHQTRFGKYSVAVFPFDFVLAAALPREPV